MELARDLAEEEKKKLKEWRMKKKADKMQREREKASIENEEAKIQILKAEESIETTIGMLDKNYVRLDSRPNDPTVWKERCSLVGDYMSNWKKKLDFVRDFAEKHFVKNDLFWTSRFTVLGKIGSEFANKELECTKRFLPKGTNNYQAWSYREWIIQKFDKCLWKSELQYCHEILKKDKFNVSVWIQMCHAARQLNHRMGEKSRLEEAVYAKEAIVAHPGNEGPWTYLKVLYAEHKETLYTNPYLECIFVDVLAEAADRVKLARELDPGYVAAYSSVANRGCAHAMNLFVDLMINGYKMNQNRRLVNAMNVLFRSTVSICVAVFMSDAWRVRYCHKYRGFEWFEDHFRFDKMGLEYETEAQDDTLCNDGDDLSLDERFGNLLRDTIFEKHPNWKDCLIQIYSEKQSRSDNEALEQDLKWDIRRCVVKDKGTEADAMEELQFTTDIIKVDAYDRRAWLHRQWVMQTFVGDWNDEEEKKLCDDILEKDACNSFAWDHRYYVVTRLVQNLGPGKYDEMMINNKVQYQLLQQQEAEYAITKFISVEPGNPFPWAHIISVYTAYKVSRLVRNEKVKEAILQVLVKNKDSIVAEGDAMVNASGIINAMNMLLDLVVNYNYSIWEDEKFRGIMNELCPDSCFQFKTNTTGKSVFLLQRMVKAFSEVDLAWKNVADHFLTEINY